jgi:hypothetical protein
MDLRKTEGTQFKVALKEHWGRGQVGGPRLEGNLMFDLEQDSVYHRFLICK